MRVDNLGNQRRQRHLARPHLGAVQQLVVVEQVLDQPLQLLAVLLHDGHDLALRGVQRRTDDAFGAAGRLPRTGWPAGSSARARCGAGTAASAHRAPPADHAATRAGGPAAAFPAAPGCGWLPGAGAPELADDLLELADRLVDQVGEQQRERHRQQRQGAGDEDHAGACRVRRKQLRGELRVDLQPAAVPGSLRLAADRVEQREGRIQARGIPAPASTRAAGRAAARPGVRPPGRPWRRGARQWWPVSPAAHRTPPAPGAAGPHPRAWRTGACAAPRSSRSPCNCCVERVRVTVRSLSRALSTACSTSVCTASTTAALSGATTVRKPSRINCRIERGRQCMPRKPGSGCIEKGWRFERGSPSGGRRPWLGCPRRRSPSHSMRRCFRRPVSQMSCS